MLYSHGERRMPTPTTSDEVVGVGMRIDAHQICYLMGINTGGHTHNIAYLKIRTSGTTALRVANTSAARGMAVLLGS